MDREFLGRHRSVNSVSVGLGLSLPVHRSQSTTLVSGKGRIIRKRLSDGT